MVKDISQLTRDEVTMLADSDYSAVPKLREQGDAWSEAARLARYVQSTLESRMSQRLGTSDTASVRSLLKQIGGTGKSAVSLAASAERRSSTLGDTADEAERLKTAVDQLNGEAAEAAASHSADPDIAFQGYNGISDPDAGYQAYLSDVTEDLRSQVRLSSNTYEEQVRMHHDAPVNAFAGPGEWTGPMPDRMPQSPPMSGVSDTGGPFKRPVGGGEYGGSSSGGYGGSSGDEGVRPTGSSGSVSSVSSHGEPILQSGSTPVTTNPAPGGGPAPISSGGGTSPSPTPLPGGGTTNPPRPVTPPTTSRPTPGGSGPVTGSRPTPSLPNNRPPGSSPITTRPTTGSRPVTGTPGGPTTGNRPGPAVPGGQNTGGRPVTGTPTGTRPGPNTPGGQNTGGRPVTGTPTGTRPGPNTPGGQNTGGRPATGASPSGGPRSGTGAGGGATRPAGTGAAPLGSKASRSLLPNQRGTATPGAEPPRQATRPGAGTNRPTPGGFSSPRSTVPSVIGSRSTGQPAARPQLSPGSITGSRSGRVASRIGARPKVNTKAPAGKVIGGRSRPGSKPGAASDHDELRLRAQTRRRFLNEIEERKALTAEDNELLRGIDATVVPGVITSSPAASTRVRRSQAGRVFGPGGWEG